MIKLSDLQAQGAFVDGALLKKSVRYRLGDTDYEADVFVRRLSIGDRERMYLEGQEEGRSRAALMISHSIRLGEQGEEQLTFEQAYQLDASLAEALMKTIREVNGGAEDDPKASARPNGSSTISPLPSAE